MQMHGGRKACSPTAQLLRSSRLFALPDALPRPITAKRGGDYDSPNTTLPYPIRQAIETPHSSRHRGDYGFKRNLPLKKIQNHKNPVVRLVELDSVEKVTDYEFAADHAQTLKKIQELGVGMQMESTFHQRATAFSARKTSPFEDEIDNTVKVISDSSLVHSAQRRWKYASQKILDLSGPRFDSFLRSLTLQHGTPSAVGRVQRASAIDRMLGAPLFLKFLRQKIYEEHKNRRRAESGADTVSVHLTQEIYQMEIKQLRDEFMQEHQNLSSKLHNYIFEYLDLPPFETETRSSRNRQSENKAIFKDPRSTHPSAGLSYLRTNSVLENHPLFGPQDRRKAVPGRVLQAMSGTHKNNSPNIGVAGVVSKFSASQSSGATRVSDDWNPDQPGGVKTWVHVHDLYVERDGRIELGIARAAAKDADIAQGKWPFALTAQEAATRQRSRKETRAQAFQGAGSEHNSRAQREENFAASKEKISRLMNLFQEKS